MKFNSPSSVMAPKHGMLRYASAIKLKTFGNLPVMN